MKTAKMSAKTLKFLMILSKYEADVCVLLSVHVAYT